MHDARRSGMKTAVTGFPRIGSLRELKFATEKYFRQELTEQKLRETARQIRITQWNLQKQSGIDYISSNDFSFYDNMLDLAVLFGMVPKRYRDLNLSELDTYFAMARGYQGENGDIRALAMKKWFNTNYHYMVPEIEDDTQIRLSGEKPFEEYLEAKAEGIETKPVVIGAFTLLKLARYSGEKREADFAEEAIQAYRSFLKRFDELDVDWVQFDEPYLVHDLTSEDIRLFEQLYDGILKGKGGVKVLLQTYFGDIRDIYQEVAELDFDGVGLDFVEGKESLRLVTEHGFPADKILFAGLVNGKNIWRNHYEKTLDVLERLSKMAGEIVINTSCSLLHVPYTLRYETKLSEEIKEHFAFAQEKLQELRELAEISELSDVKSDDTYVRNAALFEKDRKCSDSRVTKRVKAIEEKDFIRLPSFEEREQIQKREFALPIFPTTTIGSFPQTTGVKAKRKELRVGQITQEAYNEFVRGKISECVALQEELGLDVLVHGEYERNDMVEYFGEQLNGYVFTEKAWVQSYGTRCTKPPVIWGDISRNAPMTVEWSVYAQSLTEKPMKGMLTGPVTILNWSFPREDISRQECAYQIALAICDEVLDLEAHGIRMIQVDEAALREKLPLRKSDWYTDYLDWAIKAFRLVHSKVKPETQIHTHMCYSEFTDIIPAIDDMDADVITFEASRSDLQILDALQENHFRTEVGPGVYDIHSPRVPSVSEIHEALQKMAQKVDPQKLWVNPDCGLKTRGPKETGESLSNMVQAAVTFRQEYDG